MKHSTLFFRSLIVVVLLAGFAHYFSYGAQQNTLIANIKSPTQEGQQDSITSKENTISQNENNLDLFIGKWKVSYNSDDFDGAVIYDIKKEGATYNAYTYEYADKDGYTEKAEAVKTLVIQKFEGKLGEGTYFFEYEGKKYDAACSIKLIDDSTFTLSYEYYGYADVETWKKI
ncbi:MAG: hypothetical protein AAFO07_17755 [Bacteroidota bacterium]